MALARSASLARVVEFGMGVGDAGAASGAGSAATKLEIMAIGTILCNNSRLFRCFAARRAPRCRVAAALSDRWRPARGGELGLGGLPFSAGRFLGGVALFPVTSICEPGWGFSFWGDD